jgi:hypothetical protein
MAMLDEVVYKEVGVEEAKDGMVNFFLIHVYCLFH